MSAMVRPLWVMDIFMMIDSVFTEQNQIGCLIEIGVWIFYLGLLCCAFVGYLEAVHCPTFAQFNVQALLSLYSSKGPTFGCFEH